MLHQALEIFAGLALLAGAMLLTGLIRAAKASSLVTEELQAGFDAKHQDASSSVNEEPLRFVNRLGYETLRPAAGA